eukprot:Awhi_evm1s14246
MGASLFFGFSKKKKQDQQKPKVRTTTNLNSCSTSSSSNSKASKTTKASKTSKTSKKPKTSRSSSNSKNDSDLTQQYEEIEIDSLGKVSLSHISQPTSNDDYGIDLKGNHRFFSVPLLEKIPYTANNNDSSDDSYLQVGLWLGHFVESKLIRQIESKNGVVVCYHYQLHEHPAFQNTQLLNSPILNFRDAYITQDEFEQIWKNSFNDQYNHEQMEVDMLKDEEEGVAIIIIESEFQDDNEVVIEMQDLSGGGVSEDELESLRSNEDIDEIEEDEVDLGEMRLETTVTMIKESASNESGM